MELEAIGKSDKGLRRKINEDNFFVDPALDLYVVADGMGGHKAGEVASRMVVDTMSDYWRKVRSREFSALSVPDQPGNLRQRQAPDQLHRFVQHADP